MADDGGRDKTSAEQRKLQQAADGRKAMLDYEAEAAAVRAKTERLRALRLARDAAAPPPPARTASGKAVRKATKASKSKPQPLSEWLSDQRKDGRRD
jgi:hypothetical protein